MSSRAGRRGKARAAVRVFLEKQQLLGPGGQGGSGGRGHSGCLPSVGLANCRTTSNTHKNSQKLQSWRGVGERNAEAQD